MNEGKGEHASSYNKRSNIANGQSERKSYSNIGNNQIHKIDL